MYLCIDCADTMNHNNAYVNPLNTDDCDWPELIVLQSKQLFGFIMKLLVYFLFLIVSCGLEIELIL